MKTKIIPMVCFNRSLALLVVAGALTFSPAVSVAKEAEAAKPEHADKGAVLPLTATFAKDAAAKTEAPYVLTLTNTSAQALKVKVKVDMSVAVHNRPKDRELKQEIAPGKEWKIDDLAAEDKVTVKAEGFKALKLTVH